MDLRLELVEQGGWSVLQVGGEVDVATAPRLREQLIKLVNDQRFRIVVDLGGVDLAHLAGELDHEPFHRIRGDDGTAEFVVVEDFFESPQRYVPGLSGTQVNGRSQLS